jgi:hypothetical protein
MSPDLLQLFAHHMPNVQSLKLNARYYSSEKYAKVGMMEDISGVSGSFHRDVAIRVY